MALQRPLKEGTVRTYQEKVGLGFTDILASEMDADLDTIYAAWNGTLGGDLSGTLPTPTILAGAVTTAKLADAPNGVTTGKLNDLAVTTAKLSNGAVTTAKLGVKAATPVAQTVGTPLADGTIATATEQVVCQVDATYRGGLIFVLFDMTLNTYLPESGTLVLRIYLDAGVVSARNVSGGPETTTGPCSGVVATVLGNVPAGAHTITGRWIRAVGAGTWVLHNANLCVVEFA